MSENWENVEATDKTRELTLQTKPVTYNLPNGDEMKLTMNMVREYCVSGKKEMVTDQELNYFIQTCKGMRLNPFLKECWLIKYSATDPAQIITSIHKLRAIAMSHKLCQGWTKGLILYRDGEEARTSGFVPDGYVVVGAFFKATPKGWTMPYELEINLKGYIKKTSAGDVTKFWKIDNHPTMMMKVVESQGLRALFSEATKDLYVAEEFPQEVYDIAQPDQITGPEIPEQKEPEMTLGEIAKQALDMKPPKQAGDEPEKTTEDPPPEFKPCSPRVYNPIKDLLRFLGYYIESGKADIPTAAEEELKARTIDGSTHWNKLPHKDGETWLAALETERDEKLETKQAAEPKEAPTTETTDPDNTPGEWSPPSKMKDMVPDLYMALSGFEGDGFQFTQAQVNSICEKCESPEGAKHFLETDPEGFEAMVKDVIK